MKSIRMYDLPVHSRLSFKSIYVTTLPSIDSNINKIKI